MPGAGSRTGAATGDAPAPAPARRSLGALLAVCFLVLVLAATVTFIALRYRAQLGF